MNKLYLFYVHHVSFIDFSYGHMMLGCYCKPSLFKIMLQWLQMHMVLYMNDFFGTKCLFSLVTYHISIDFNSFQ